MFARDTERTGAWLNLPACPEGRRWRWKGKVEATGRRSIVSSSVRRPLDSTVISNICNKETNAACVFYDCLRLIRSLRVRCNKRGRYHTTNIDDESSTRRGHIEHDSKAVRSWRVWSRGDWSPGRSYYTHFVTLNTLSNRTQRSTETPRGGIILLCVKIISLIEPITTKQSKRLNSETK